MDYSNASLMSDDIVFEERNKTYGAFVLRRVYKDTILKAYVIAGLIFFSFVFGPVIAERFKPEEVEEEEVEVKIDPKLITPPPIDPKVPPPPPVTYSAPPPPPVSTIKFVPPVMVDDDKVKEEDPPKQEELVKAVAGTETVQGDPNADPNQVIVEGPSGNGTGIAPPPAEEEIFLVVEQQPTFPGGDGEMISFVKKNIKYPYTAQKAEVQGTVYVEFVVNSDGHLSDHKILKGHGFGLDEEAMRVVKMFPDWTPGKNNGKAVKVRVSVPIKFRLAS
jgi:protein TonB